MAVTACRRLIESSEHSVSANMPPNRIQSRAWFVDFWLAARVNDSITPSDAEIRPSIKDIFDVSNTCRRIRSLQHVSFAYTFGEPARSDVDVIQAAIVDVVGFEHSNESIRETTIQSWIQDPRVMDQRWSPVSVTPGSNWMQQDIIKNFFAECEGGLSRPVVDWRRVWSELQGRATAAPRT